jgi:small subunit ribosomal protein S8
MNAITDLIIRVKNGYMSKKEVIESPHSVYREAVLKKLLKLGYVKSMHVEGEIIKKITITLKYESGVGALTDVKIFSKPGRRWYVTTSELKPVLGGLGCSILSTSKGIMTNKEAKKLSLGGELLFSIW